MDLYESFSSTYFTYQCNAITIFFGWLSVLQKLVPTISYQACTSVGRPSFLSTTSSSFSFSINIGTSYMVRASIASITASGATLQKRASFWRMSSSIGQMLRQTKISGCTPYSNNDFTECCVGLVFNSPVVCR